MQLLDKLCSVSAVSGAEAEIANTIKEYASDFCDDVYIDDAGSVVAKINNSSDTNVLLEAHIDQIGLVVKSIDENGFIKFAKSGGINPSILPTAEVTVHGKKELFGIIGAKPPHLQNEDDKKLSDCGEMYIDCGLSKEEIEKIVTIGDTISLCSKFSELKNDFYASGALDNRVGVFVLLECLKRLKNEKSPYNVTALFSTQEEVGCRGAVRSAEKLNPDFAVVVDVTFGISPYTNEENGFKTDGLITVAVGPNLDRLATNKLMDVCKAKNIPFEKEVCSSNPGTNSWPIQVSGLGVRCVLVSVPIKYMHTTVETVNSDAIENAINCIHSALQGGVFDA